MFRTSVLSSDDWLRQKKNLLLDDICDDVDNKEHVFCPDWWTPGPCLRDGQRDFYHLSNYGPWLMAGGFCLTSWSIRSPMQDVVTGCRTATPPHHTPPTPPNPSLIQTELTACRTTTKFPETQKYSSLTGRCQVVVVVVAEKPVWVSFNCDRMECLSFNGNLVLLMA